MVTIEVHNAVSQLKCPDTVLYRLISDHLSYTLPGSEFAMANRPGWDGRVRLLKAHGFFPTGLIPRLQEFLQTQRVRYQAHDRRTHATKLSTQLEMADWFHPRDYQVEAIEMTDRYSRGVFVMGTGGGKTLTAGGIIARRNVPALFITPDTGLRSQTYKVFHALFGDAVSQKVKSKAPIVVSNIQSLVRQKPEDLKRFGMLMIDEFHHGAAKSYTKVNSWCDGAYHRYGFTGTFTRPDGADMTMHGVLSEVIFKKTTSELIESGWLVRPYITILRYQVKGWSRLNYQEAYNAIIDDHGFNDLVADVARKKIAEEKQTLVLVRRKAHGELLRDMIPGSTYLSGDDPVEYRNDVVKRFIEKEIPCIIATNIFGEGTDIPSIEVLINARCQKTEIQTKQGIGRALRKMPGKEKAEVFDFLILGQKHLKQHSLDRIFAYKEEPAFKISVRREI